MLCPSFFLEGSDKIPPILVVNPLPPVTNQETIQITGSTDKGSVVKVNGKKATTKPNGDFVGEANLKPGKNPITVTAEDGSGNVVSKVLYVVLDTELPSVLLETKGPFYNADTITLKGRVEPGCTVIIREKSGAEVAKAVVVHDKFEAKNIKLAPAPSTNEFIIEATDPAGNVMTTEPYVIENIERIEIELTSGRASVLVNGEEKMVPEAYTMPFGPYQIFELLGATATANTVSGSVTVELGGKKIEMTVGQKTATVDGSSFVLYYAPKNGNMSILLPIKEVADLLGCLTWTDADAVLHIQFDNH